MTARICTLAHALVAAGAALIVSDSARADDKTPGAGDACVLAGTAPVARGTKLYDEATGGEAIATFTGALAPMQMRDIPAGATGPRARLHTTENGGTLRLDGFIEPSKIQMFAKRDIPVVSGHVWIASGHEVKFVKAEPDKITVEHEIAGTKSKKVAASATCGALALEPGPVKKQDVDGHARGFMMKTNEIDLYDKPNGNVVFSLDMIEGTGQLFYSTKVQGGFVQVQSRSDLVIDAWAKWSDLDALKPGEMMDQLAPTKKVISGAQLKLDDAPAVVRATVDIPIRAKRETNAPAIGLIEVGAEIYVLETRGNFTNVLPKELYVQPEGSGGFWIPKDEVPASATDGS